MVNGDDAVGAVATVQYINLFSYRQQDKVTLVSSARRTESQQKYCH